MSNLQNLHRPFFKFTLYNRTEIPLPIVVIMSLRSFSRLPTLTLPTFSKTYISHPATKGTATIIKASSTSRRALNTSSSKMATQGKSEAGQVISDVARREGGTYKGIVSSSISPS